MTVRAFAPGRVNLIGEHTDYNGGLALPFAIPLGVTVTADPIAGRKVEVTASDLGERDAFDLGDITALGGWRAFVRGTVAELVDAGHALTGARLRIEGTVPPGQGVASSAALEVALCLALLAASGIDTPDLAELAVLCSRAEHRWTGARTGTLDQLASLLCEAGQALRIDFRSLELRQVPLALGDWALVLAPSGDDRSLAASGYNRRREECDEAAARVGAPTLREVTRRDAEALPGPLRRRALHVIDENERVDATVACLGEGRLDALGALLSASHESLRDLYEVSTPAVEATVGSLLHQGAAGARLMGGGFGGQVLALFPPSTRPRPPALEVAPAPGARLLGSG